MADHGLLFTDAIARRIAQGTKTVTRRPITPQNTRTDEPFKWYEIAELVALPDTLHCRVRPGDLLYAKEVWKVVGSGPGLGQQRIAYRAGGATVVHDMPARSRLPKSSGRDVWQSSMIMPRWAARSVRRVVSVGAERLGSLTEGEARAEGFDSPAEFVNAWDAAYRERGLLVCSRPWVWRIEFADRNEPAAERLG